MLSELICTAPAKLNLFLHITGRRADGYHNLQTVFQFLDFGDCLHFKLRHDDQITLHDNSGLEPETNIVLRAASLLTKHRKARVGINISLNKRIPIGGGLGGGSSNAATTLLALNHLWQLHLPPQILASYALSLGADVPVFVHGHAAFAEGVGEQLQSIKLVEPWYLVLIPNCQVNTAKFFSHPELTRDTPTIKISDFQPGFGHNDFTSLAKTTYPQIAAAMDWLKQYTDARLTGSGCCVFGEFAERIEAERLLAQLPANLKGFIAKGLNESPLRFLVSHH